MPDPHALRIVVLGAGAIGCFIGGSWKAAGLDVRFIGRAHTADDIAKHGLVLSDTSGWRCRHAPEEVDFQVTPDCLSEADLILLTVKCTALAEAANEIAGHARAEAAVLSLLNGVRPVTQLKDMLPGRQVIAGMVPFNVAALGEGRWRQATGGKVTVEKASPTEQLAQMLSTSHADLALAGDMTSVAWGKLLLNLNNPINALSGLSLHEELSQRGYRKVLAASMREALDVLRTAGIRPARVAALPPAALPAMLETPDWLFRAVGLPLQKIDRTARSSMADDLARGAKTEIDFLNGEIVELARRHGVPAPVNGWMVELVRNAEANGLRRYSAKELAEAVGCLA